MQHYSPQEIKKFQKTVRGYYAVHSRDMPWRQPEADGKFDPYKIMVSEIMLQQTQVVRVRPEYETFIQKFHDISSLARASLADVLKEWSGLGYNRRAKFLWLSAQEIETNYQGIVPSTIADLQKLPGIGPNTAAAIAVYAYNRPVTFIETNIRTVFIHHFFEGRTNITDTDILELVRLALPNDLIREWYWALMDYGTFVKSTVGNVNKQAKNYATQATFIGSNRQVRGKILKLLHGGPLTLKQIQAAVVDERVAIVCKELRAEKLIHYKDGRYCLG